MSGARVSPFILAALVAAVLTLPVATGSGARAAASARESAIFYYPWYSTPTRDGRWAHWYVERDGTPVLSTPYFPSRGLYSSSNVRVVQAQMREIAAAGVTTVVVSWWGAGSPEDHRLTLVSEAARRHGLEVALHLEPYRGRTPHEAAADISRLHAAGVRDFYVYDADREPPAAWANALAEVEGDVRIFGNTTLVGRAKAAGFDGLYTYDVITWTGSTFRRLCTQAHRAGLLCAPSVGPGYDARLATSDRAVRPRLYGATYDRMWKTALEANADVVTITSYNEWQEGTQIEPAQSQIESSGYEGAWGRHGVAARYAYLEATARWTERLQLARRQ